MKYPVRTKAIHRAEKRKEKWALDLLGYNGQMSQYVMMLKMMYNGMDLDLITYKNNPFLIRLKG